jgi:ArsR family transcriptional regulator
MSPGTIDADADVRLLAALADPMRLSIVRQLSLCDEVCVCDLDAGAAVRQPTVSHHLRVLREAGIIRGERRGTWVFYRIEPAAFERLRSILRSIEPAAIAGGSHGDRGKPAGRGTRLPVLEARPS